MKNEITSTPTVSDFVSALNRGEEALREAASILCNMVDADPKTYEKINKETGLDWKVLGNLERVGRGAMHYKQLFDMSPASKYIGTLPASQQESIYKNGVTVVSTINGKTIVENKTPQSLSPREARTVFGDKHVRSIDEQRAVQLTEIVAPGKPAQRYEIDNDKLIIMSSTVFTMSQLEDILERMKTKAIKSWAKKK